MACKVKLLDAICSAYDKYNSGIYEYNRRTGKATYCNKFVNQILNSYGIHYCDGMFANEMIDTIKDNDDMFQILYTYKDAHFFANAGALVVAYKKYYLHGHICVVRPSEMVFSPKWNIKVPCVANIGKKNFIGKGLNWAFSDRPEISYVVQSLYQ